MKANHKEWEVTHSDFGMKRFKELEQDGIQTRSLNFMKKPIGINEYDLITAWEVIEHIPFSVFSSVMERIRTALRPGGYFIFSTPDMDSPLCRMNDFFAICPPFHYTVFGRRWLRHYFRSINWEVKEMVSCSDFLDDSEMWCDYAGTTAPSFQLRSTAQVLKVLLKESENKRRLLDSNMGTEVICVLRKT